MNSEKRLRSTRCGQIQVATTHPHRAYFPLFVFDEGEGRHLFAIHNGHSPTHVKIDGSPWERWGYEGGKRGTNGAIRGFLGSFGGIHGQNLGAVMGQKTGALCDKIWGLLCDKN